MWRDEVEVEDVDVDEEELVDMDEVVQEDA